MDLIFNPAKFFYGLVQIFAKSIDLIVSVCQQICGIPDKNGKSILVDLISPDANDSTIYITFAIMIGITITLSLFNAMAESFNFKNETGITPYKPYANVFKSATYMIVISFCFPIVILLVGQLGHVVQDLVAGGNDQTIGATILMNCFDTNNLSANDFLKWQNAWSNGIPDWNILLEANSNVVQTFNVWQSIISIGVMISPLIAIFMYMCKRLINILMLYVVSPIAFAMMPRDEGFAKDEWFNNMKSALLGGIIIMIIFTLFINISPMLYTIELVADDNLMNSLFQSALVGAAAMCVLSVGKTVLKFMGCDDKMLAMQSASPMRALGAIKRSAGSIYRGAKSLRSGKSGSGGKSGENMGDGGSMDMVARFNRIENNRYRDIQKNIAMKKASLSGSRTTYSGNVPRRRGLTSNAYMPSYKLTKTNKTGITKPQTIKKPNTTSATNALKNNISPATKPINSKFKSFYKTDKTNANPKNIKQKNMKNNENSKLNKTFDKFIKKFGNILKPLTAKAKLNARSKIELKKPIKKNTHKPIKLITTKPIKLKPMNNIDGKNNQTPRIRINNAIRNNNIVNTKQSIGVDSNLKQKLLSNEKLLKENLKKIKNVNLNIQSVPRKINKIVRKIK